MKTSEQIADEFKRELAELLAKYDAYIQAENKTKDYDESGIDIIMTVYVTGKWDDDGNTIVPYTEINLGKYF